MEHRSHIIGFKEEINKANKKSKDSFFSLFDGAKDTDTSFIRGNWDFDIHIILSIAEYIEDPEDKIILEIGHGGGRMLAAASRHFKECIGIDVHENNKFVENELKMRGVHNFKLIKTDGEHIQLNDNSIDVVYSFIVLQHVEKIDIFKSYLRETYRVLKPNGIAILYFGRNHKLSINKSSKLLYLLDCILENFYLPNGYKEIPAKVNHTNLRITLGYAKKTCAGIGFKILKTSVSHKKVPNGIKLFGGQHCLLLMK